MSDVLSIARARDPRYMDSSSWIAVEPSFDIALPEVSANTVLVRTAEGVESGVVLEADVFIVPVAMFMIWFEKLKRLKN